MPIRVLVVDDSVLFRTRMQLSLGDKDIKVVGCASNTTEAAARIEELSPDVVTLDIEMPGVNGIDFLRGLMKKHPVPVVVVSSLCSRMMDALTAGAVEFVCKPEAGEPDAFNRFISDMRSKVRISCHAQVRPAYAPSALTSSLARKTKIAADNSRIIAIGASTGGTEAILAVVKDLPASTPGVIVVQHMPANFTRLYSERLDKICNMRVKEAADMDRVEKGRILIAAGGFHMRLYHDANGYYIRSQPGEKVSGHCPSVNVLFDSVAEAAGKNAIGVLLTGMGSDGATGLLKMRDAGAYTIGQDEESCVVYGMPMEAYKLGAVCRQLPLDSICGELIYTLNQSATKAAGKENP
jgi:two-component system chemotaxis response regulator CheB